MNLNLEKFEKAFTEWDIRYRNNPEDFMDAVTHLLRNTPYSYGKACAVYFSNLLEGVTE
jgi:hypothetical protein